MGYFDFDRNIINDYNELISITDELSSAIDENYNDTLHLDQTTPQSFTSGTVSGTGFLKVTSGALGLATVNPDVQATDTKMIAGFVDRNSTLSITATSGEFTLTITKHVDYPIAFYCNGVKFSKVGNDSITISGLSATGTYWIYYGADGNIAYSPSTWSILGGLSPIAIVFYQHSTTSAICYDERHGCGRNLE